MHFSTSIYFVVWREREKQEKKDREVNQTHMRFASLHWGTPDIGLKRDRAQFLAHLEVCTESINGRQDRLTWCCNNTFLAFCAISLHNHDPTIFISKNDLMSSRCNAVRRGSCSTSFRGQRHKMCSIVAWRNFSEISSVVFCNVMYKGVLNSTI